MPDDLIVIALPGFTRQPRHLRRMAAACERRGWVTLTPSLAPRWWPTRYMNRAHLRHLANGLADHAEGGPVVIAGHSAGASAGTYLAKVLRDLAIDVRGLVLIDGVDSPNHLIARTLPALQDLRIAAVIAPPSPCNRSGRLAQSLTSFPEVRVDLIDGAGHGDIEGPGIAVYRRACKDTSDEATAQRFIDAVLDAIEWAGIRPKT